MKIKQITENTTSGSIATTETALGGTQSRGNPSIYGGKKVGSLFKGKKTKAPYANSINESAELSEAQLEEDDVIVVPGQGRSRKTGFVKHDPDRAEHEGQTLKNSLHTIVRVASHLNKELSVRDNFPEWVSEKIGAVKSDMVSVMDYLISSKEMQGVAEGSVTPDVTVNKVHDDGHEKEWHIYRGKEMIGYVTKNQPDTAEGLYIAYGHGPGRAFVEEFTGLKPAVNYIASLKQGVAEGYQLDEGAIETITALVKKIPGIGKYYQMAQQYKPQLIQILKTSKSGKEVKQKMEQLIAGQSMPVAESGMMKQLGGLAVGGGSILSTMWMNAMGMIDGVLAHAAAGEVGGAVASGSILGLIPVTLMLFAAMLLFKGSQQSSDEKAQAFQAQRGQQGVAEGKRNLKCVCKTQGTLQCPVHTPKDIEVIEGAKVDRMVKHVAQSEKKLGHSKKEAENIAWATANKRGMLDNKNKKA